MRSLAALLLVLATVAPALAQPRSMPGPPPPSAPSRGWFFDLFAPPRVYAPPPPAGAPRQGTTPRQGAPTVPGQPGPAPAPGEPPRAATPPGAVPPYEADLLRLAEIIGALHYLRPLCGANEGQRWRVEMQALIDAEAQSDDRKERLTRSFNRGYFAFERSYRTCTPAATLAIERYLDEGARIARDIVARYSN